MKPKSSTLFHFTKNIDYLQGILSGGFLPRYCLEDTRWLGIEGHDFMAYPMVCFCDIPLSRISEHTDFYGAYGIGMTKDWGLRNDLAPLIYSPPQSVGPRVVDHILRADVTGKSKKKIEFKNENEVALAAMLSFIKPISGRMLIGGAPIEKDFYQESEWRYVPTLDDGDKRILFQEDFEKNRDHRNSEIGSHVLEFTPQDIKYVFVANEHEIPSMFDFITTKLEHFPHKDVKLLTTRLVSLESVSRDV